MVVSCILESGNPIFNGDLTVSNTGEGLELDGAANPVVTLAGNFNATDGGASMAVSMGSGIWTVSGDFNILGVTQFNHNSGTLRMNGVDKTLTTNVAELNNFELTGGAVTIVNDLWINQLTLTSGVLTAPTSGTFTISGQFTNNATFVHNSGVVSMRGTHDITGSSSTAFNWLTIYGTISVPSDAQDITVATKLDMTNGNSLSIETGRKITLLPAATLTLVGTISGAGTLVYQSTTAFPTGGVISSLLRMDATNNDQSMNARTYGGQVEIYNNSSSTNRTVTLASASAYTFSSNLYLNAANTKDVTLDVSTNSPAVNITSDLDFNGSGAGTEYIKAGDGTWTVSGSADFTDGLFAPTFVELSPTWNKIASQVTEYSEGFPDCVPGTPAYYCSVTGLEIGLDNQSYGGMVCPATDTDYASASKFSTAGISDSALVTSALLRVNVTTANTAYARIIRYATDTPNSDACTGANTGLYMRAKGTDGTTLMSPDWTTTGIKNYNIGSTEVAQIQSRLTDNDAIAYAFYDYDIESSVPSAASSHSLLVGYATATTSTLVMNGSGKTLTSAGSGYINLTLSGSISLSGDTLVVANTLICLSIKTFKILTIK
jgi:hypothetical protein